MKRTVVKIWSRLLQSTFYGASQTIQSLIRFFTAWLVFRVASPELWGEFIQISIMVQLVSLGTNWGQRDYLIKKFSLRPKNIDEEWGSNLASRSLLLLAAILLTFLLPLPEGSEPIIALWLIGQYLSSSFQVLVLYLKNFKFSFWAEFLSGMVLPLVVYFSGKELSLNILINAITGVLFLKFLLYALWFKKFIHFKNFKFKKPQLQESLPYFLPSLAGVAQSRVDLYIVALFLEEKSLAYYNVFMGLLSFSYNGINFIMAPFAKNIYRIQAGSLRRLHRNFILLSLGVSVIAMIMVKLVIENYYDYLLPDYFYGIGALNIIAFTTYVFIINKFFRFDLQKVVAVVPLIILLLQLPIAMLLIKSYLLTGAILTNFIGQILVVVSFLYLDFRYTNKTKGS